jgi:hypothetical protein
MRDKIRKKQKKKNRKDGREDPETTPARRGADKFYQSHNYHRSGAAPARSRW